jgi:hypothetical protein
MAWMLLPAGTFEKWVSRLFLTGVGHAVAFTIAWCLVTALAEIINRSLFSFACPWFSPFQPGVMLSIGLYTVLQSPLRRYSGGPLGRRPEAALGARDGDGGRGHPSKLTNNLQRPITDYQWISGMRGLPAIRGIAPTTYR